MADMDAVTAAKSDQFNADDLVGTEITVTVEDVAIRAGTEQPITVKLVGHDKVFRPCKTVARIMKAAWGADSAVYKGRSMLLFRDDNVTWGGMKVGGIRVRAISHITQPLVLALQEKKGSRKMTTVQPLKAEAKADAGTDDPAFKYANGCITRLNGFDTADQIAAFEEERATKLAELLDKRPDQHARVMTAVKAAYVRVEAANEGPADEQRGEAHTEEPADA